MAALAACLAVLEDRFAYSQPLRLALLSLAQGRPELLAEAEAPPLTVVPEAHEPAAALPKLQAAVAERKTVEFTYYAISRDEEMERIVDPYGLQLVAGEWYLIGWCHRARPSAPSASRASARASSTTRAGRTTSRRRRTSTSRAYRDRPAWQLAAAPRHGAGARLAGHGVVGRGALGPLRHGGAAGRRRHRLRDALRRRAAAPRLGAGARRRGRTARAGGPPRAAARAARAGSPRCSTRRRPSDRPGVLRPRRPLRPGGAGPTPT